MHADLLLLASYLFFLELKPVTIGLEAVARFARILLQTLSVGAIRVVTTVGRVVAVVESVPYAVKLLELLVPIAPIIEGAVLVHVLPTTEATVKVFWIVVLRDAISFGLGLSVYLIISFNLGHLDIGVIFDPRIALGKWRRHAALLTHLYFFNVVERKSDISVVASITILFFFILRSICYAYIGGGTLSRSKFHNELIQVVLNHCVNLDSL
jgi:hypothetical protein